MRFEILVILVAALLAFAYADAVSGSLNHSALFITGAPHAYQ